MQKVVTVDGAEEVKWEITNHDLMGLFCGVKSSHDRQPGDKCAHDDQCRAVGGVAHFCDTDVPNFGIMCTGTCKPKKGDREKAPTTFVGTEKYSMTKLYSNLQHNVGTGCLSSKAICDICIGNTPEQATSMKAQEGELCSSADDCGEGLTCGANGKNYLTQLGDQAKVSMATTTRTVTLGKVDLKGAGETHFLCSGRCTKEPKKGLVKGAFKEAGKQLGGALNTVVGKLI